MDLTDYLDYIDPTTCDYQEWVEVGMALKAEGYTASIWDEWSAKDPRYKPGECYAKWETFESSGVKGGTIAHMAMERGYTKSTSTGSDSKFFGFDELLNVNDYKHSPFFLNATPKDMAIKPMYPEGYRQLIEYLLTLYEPDDHVSYVVQAQPNQDGGFSPTSGNYSFTAGELVQRLENTKDIDLALGTTDKGVGAWIRFNPVDGQGIKDKNITKYRYTLVESDSLPVPEQKLIYEKLQLPIAALVYSGRKSLHAIVKINARSESEYKKKVSFIYNVCEAHGLTIDKNNKNPSRLSRMPGVQRGEEIQSLVAVNTGHETFNDWKAWYQTEEQKNYLPDVVSFSELILDMPPVAPVSIHGLLREGHKMILTGPSKAGKSFALQSLAICYAEGTRWFGEFRVKQGKVFYINLEIDPPSFYQRILKVYEALGIPEEERHYENISIWNMRGYSEPLNKLVPVIINLVKDKGYSAVIIDPIYKVITGDENSAKDMGEFCNQFDRIATETGCSVIYCHHHSKSAVNHRESMNRGSGSTVFSRDPDAILDLTKYEQSQEYVDAMIEFLENVQLKKDIEAFAQVKGIDTTIEGWEGDFSTAYPDDWNRLHENIERQLTVWKARKENKSDCWQLDATLREFRWNHPLRVWFDYPVHNVDRDSYNPELPKLATITDDSMIHAHEARKEYAQEHVEDIARIIKQLANDGEKTSVAKILPFYKQLPGQKKTSANALRLRIKRNSKRFVVVNGSVYDLLDEERPVPEEKEDEN